MPFVNGPSASVASHSLRVNEYSLSAELHLLRLRRHSLSVSVSMLLEYGRIFGHIMTPHRQRHVQSTL